MRSIIVTNQRPGVLAGALSLFSNTHVTQLNNIITGLTILDDSQNEDIQSQNRQVAADAAEAAGVALIYLGRREKKKFIGKLVEDSSPEVRQSADFALFGGKGFGLFSPGGNRNAGLLFHAGEKCFSIDDDVEPRASGLKSREQIKAAAFSLSAGKPPLLFLPFGQQKRMDSLLAQSSEKLFLNAVEEFGSLLGAGAENYSSATGVSAAVQTKIAMAGIRGGRWYRNPNAYLETEAAWHKRIWPRRNEYHTAKVNPFALVVSPELQYSNMAFFITTCYAWNGTEIMPPFFPLLRGDDSVWAQLVRICYPESPIAHIPFCVDHLRSAHTPFSTQDFDADENTLTDFLARFMEKIAPELIPLSPQDSLRGVGRRLLSLAGLSAKSMQEFITQLNLEFTGYRIVHLEEKLHNSRGCSRYWKADMQGYIQKLQTSPHGQWIPADFINQKNGNGEKLFRQYLCNIGNLLLAWPEIWEKAEKANISAGVR